MLESANRALTSLGVELEASFAQTQKMLTQRTIELEEAQAELARIDGERVSREASFEHNTDTFANFAYYDTFA